MLYNKSHCPDPTAGAAEASIRKAERQKIKAVENRLYQYASDKAALLSAQDSLAAALSDKEVYILSIGSPVLDGLPTGSGTSDPTSRKVEVMTRTFDRRIKHLEKQVEGFRRMVAVIDKAVSQLRPAEQVIIRERYFKPEKPTPYYVISEKINYSERQVKRIKKRAVMRLCRLL